MNIINSGFDEWDGTGGRLWIQVDGYYPDPSVVVVATTTYKTSPAGPNRTVDLDYRLDQYAAPENDVYAARIDPLPHFGAHEIFVSVTNIRFA